MRGGRNESRPRCVARPPADHLHFTEVEIRRFATRVGADYVDILGLSDDPGAHPQTNDGKPVFDCRHFCQRNCNMFNAWLSLLLPLLGEH